MNEQEEFAQLLDDSFKTLNIGDIVTGTVRSVGTTEITVDLPAKVTGIIPFDEASDNQGTKLCDLYKPGEKSSRSGCKSQRCWRNRNPFFQEIKREANWTAIKAGLETGEVFTGTVTEVTPSGVIVTSNFVKIFVPGSKTGVRRDESLEKLQGQTVRFRIIDINEERNRAVGSIWDVERDERREERRAKLDKFWSEIEVGKKYHGVVKSFTDFGAFVDLGGIDGMVHATELSWNHIAHPSDVVAIGDVITVYVKAFDQSISLGYRTEQQIPECIYDT